MFDAEQRRSLVIENRATPAPATFRMTGSALAIVPDPGGSSAQFFATEKMSAFERTQLRSVRLIMMQPCAHAKRSSSPAALLNTATVVGAQRAARTPQSVRVACQLRAGAWRMLRLTAELRVMRSKLDEMCQSKGPYSEATAQLDNELWR